MDGCNAKQEDLKMSFKMKITQSGIDGYDIDIKIDTHCDTPDDVSELLEKLKELRC